MYAQNKSANAKGIPVILPWEKEIIETVIQAACNFYEISREELLTRQQTEVSQIRFICFYIISRNTSCKDHAIGSMFMRKRDAVRYGIDVVDTHKKIYPQTLRNLNTVIDIANKFEKKFEWHIPKISTTS